MELFIEDVCLYAGDTLLMNQTLTEIFTVGAYFCLTVMQPGRNPAFVQALIAAFESGESPVLSGEMPYSLSRFALDLS